jgi:2-dehydro-3-deoxyphosphogluconate aldolase / (4S)-4-hydroxy-2-oxoglutarate aldolase
VILETLASTRTIAVLRAPRVDDPGALCGALVRGGIACVEFTFTTPGVEDVIRLARESGAAEGGVVGAGTVTNRDRAERAIAAGARFLVTPGVSAEVAAVAADAGIPVIMGALTPSEVMQAVELGAAAVKIFPATVVGPRYLRDLAGPFGALPLIPSGGLHAGNAAEWVAAGALAVTAGTSVVSDAAIAAGDWAGIAGRAAEFSAAALSVERP